MNDGGYDTTKPCSPTWADVIKRYAEISDEERAALQAHVAEEACDRCAAAHAQRNAAYIALEKYTEHLYQEADDSRKQVAATLMPELDAIRASQAKERVRAPQLIHIVNGAETLDVSKSRDPWHIAPAALVAAFLGYLWNALSKGNKGPRGKHVATLAPILLFAPTMLIACGMATIVLRSLLSRWSSTWWHLMMVTGVTTTVAFAVSIGLVAITIYALQSQGVDVHALLRPLLMFRRPQGRQDLMRSHWDAFVDASNIRDCENVFALAHRSPQHGQVLDLVDQRIVTVVADLIRSASGTDAPDILNPSDTSRERPPALLCVQDDAFAAPISLDAVISSLAETVAVGAFNDGNDTSRQLTQTRNASKQEPPRDLPGIPASGREDGNVTCQFAPGEPGKPTIIVCGSGRGPVSKAQLREIGDGSHSQPDKFGKTEPTQRNNRGDLVQAERAVVAKTKSAGVKPVAAASRKTTGRQVVNPSKSSTKAAAKPVVARSTRQRASISPLLPSADYGMPRFALWCWPQPINA